MTTQQETRPPDQVPTGLPRRVLVLGAAVSGVVAALVTLAVSSLIALFFGLLSPLLAVGSATIDLAPPGAKALVIALFGTGDKTFLLVLLALVVFVLAVAVGILQQRVPPFGALLLCLVAFVAVVASVSRANSTAADALPVIVGAFIGVVILRLMLRRLQRWNVAAQPGRPEPRTPAQARNTAEVERRRFLTLAAIAGIGSLAVALGSGISSAATAAATIVREKIKLPKAVSPAPVIPAAAELHIPGLTPYIVPSSQFYRIDTALAVPSIDASTWKLKITGMVEEEVELTFDELLKLPLKERIITLTCVSQEVGGNLVGNATWLGYPIRDLMTRARPQAGADMVLSTSIDGFTASTPLPVLQDPGTDALLAVGMNGAPLLPEHGFPVRMVVPGLYGYVSATKWVVNLKVTTYAKDQAYWTPRGYSAKGPIKLSSRIDTPQGGRTLPAGQVAVAGVAWHQHVGISKVEVQIDNDAWQEASLARVVTVDSWLQWSFAWQATKGDHTLTVRATDDNGEVQTSREVDVIPNGSTGLHTIKVQVS